MVADNSHSPLPADRRLRLWGEACLALRAGAAACQACATACPSASLTVGADGPALGRDCLGCGRCAAACPSGALEVSGFREAKLPTGNLPLTVECWKVPASGGPLGISVPCLGGLSPSLILRWLLDTGERTLILVDRGWCQGCAAGSGGFAGRQTLEAALTWLADCGLPRERWPKIQLLPLPAALMPSAIPSPEQRLPLSRRDFFARLGREAARSERPAARPAGTRAALRDRPCPLPARETLLASAAALAARHGRALPARARPLLVVSAACRDIGLCAGLCPTGALTRLEAEGSLALRYAADRCVACGRCQAACPEAAITLTASGGEAQPVILTHRPSRDCLECGQPYPDRGEGPVCPRCASRRQLARNLFGMVDADRS